MSLIRQLWCVLLATLVLALLGSVGVNLVAARSYMQNHLQLENGHNAAALALALSQQHGDRSQIDLMLAAQFDTGAYGLLRFMPADGGTVFERIAEPYTHGAPTWFARLAAIDPVPGKAQVSDGWRSLGVIEVTGSVAEAHDALWQGSLQVFAALCAVGLVTGLLGMLAVQRLRMPLDAAVSQAQALVEGRFITVPEPDLPEVRALTLAMNLMVGRLKANFEAQSQQLDKLRTEADIDALTGLSNRAHFLGQLQARLQREDGCERCGLVLLRLRDLAGINRTLGRAAGDRILGAIAEALRPYAERATGCFPGRLNGSDFALCLPVGNVAHETAQALAAALRAVLPGLGSGVEVALGAVELRRLTPMAEALSAADEALAHAEARGAYRAELGRERDPEDDAGPSGEAQWRQGFEDALGQGRTRLVDFPLVDAGGALVHLESPLRLQRQAEGAFEPAARWLPLAIRSRMTSEIDTRAVELALEAIAADGRPRCINIAPASLGDSGFLGGLRALLFASPRAARQLWVEVDESAAVDRSRLLQALSRQLRPCGVRLGLEHAGGRLARIERLFELGLDFIKLDPSVTLGAGRDAQRLGVVRGTIDMLHGLSLQVYAEGVNDVDDARALWACRIDGITGPWATAKSGVS